MFFALFVATHFGSPALGDFLQSATIVIRPHAWLKVPVVYRGGGGGGCGGGGGGGGGGRGGGWGGASALPIGNPNLYVWLGILPRGSQYRARPGESPKPHFMAYQHLRIGVVPTPICLPGPRHDGDGVIDLPPHRRSGAMIREGRFYQRYIEVKSSSGTDWWKAGPAKEVPFAKHLHRNEFKPPCGQATSLALGPKHANTMLI